MATETLTVEIDTALLDRLRDSGEDPKALVERLLRRAAMANETAEDFYARNKEAIDAYNAEVEARGTLSERMAGWK